MTTLRKRKKHVMKRRDTKRRKTKGRKNMRSKNMRSNTMRSKNKRRKTMRSNTMRSKNKRRKTKIWGGHVEYSCQIQSLSEPVNPLLKAAYIGDVKQLEAELNNNANVEEVDNIYNDNFLGYNWTALMFAVYEHKDKTVEKIKNMVEMLLSKNADSTKTYNCGQFAGQTPGKLLETQSNLEFFDDADKVVISEIIAMLDTQTDKISAEREQQEKAVSSIQQRYRKNVRDQNTNATNEKQMRKNYYINAWNQITAEPQYSIIRHDETKAFIKIVLWHGNRIKQLRGTPAGVKEDDPYNSLFYIIYSILPQEKQTEISTIIQEMSSLLKNEINVTDKILNFYIEYITTNLEQLNKLDINSDLDKILTWDVERIEEIKRVTNINESRTHSELQLEIADLKDLLSNKTEFINRIIDETDINSINTILEPTQEEDAAEEEEE